MADPLRNVRLKIARADEHLADLQRRINEWSTTNHVDLIQKDDPKTGWHVIRGKYLPDPPDEWAAVLGDYANNLRTALEYTAQLLVRANGATPNGATKFPIFSAPKSDASVRAALKGAHPDAIRLVDSGQPYHRKHGPDPEPLEVLATFSNVDKHIDAHPLVILSMPFDEHVVRMELLDGAAIVETRIGLVGTPISEAELFSIRLSPPNARVKMDVKSLIPADIAFGEGRVPMAKVIDLIAVTRRIVEQLAPFVTDPPPPA